MHQTIDVGFLYFGTSSCLTSNSPLCWFLLNTKGLLATSEQKRNIIIMFTS